MVVVVEAELVSVEEILEEAVDMLEEDLLLVSAIMSQVGTTLLMKKTMIHPTSIEIETQIFHPSKMQKVIIRNFREISKQRMQVEHVL